MNKVILLIIGMILFYSCSEPDEKKDGGQYITTTGRLKRFDESACMLLLKDGSNIPISHIIGLESAYFEGLF